jgi:SAM-dependent methyltransferase
LDKLVETNRERFWTPEAWIRDQWVKAHAARLPPGSRVLDAGAGSSKYRPFFAHCQYETQDFCQYQGELVKYLKPIDHVCEITSVPLPDASLDALLCTEVIEHVPDPMAALKEFSRLVKPGGKLLLTAPLGTLLHMEPYHYYGGFTHLWYEFWLPKLGFAVDSITPQGGPARASASSLQSFYSTWRTWEGNLPALKKIVSLSLRMAAKIPIHYLLPWIAPKLDPHLDQFRSSMGFMVSATRVAETRSPEA